MITAIIWVPFVAGLSAFLFRSQTLHLMLLLFTALFHSAATVAFWRNPPAAAFQGWIFLDEPGLVFLSITSLLFLMVSIYAVGYLRREGYRKKRDFEEGFLFISAPEAVFAGCILIFLSTMTLAIVSRHFGLIWVAMEATTLTSAPLIYYHRHHRSLEATWKYLIICSVGIALALLGNFFLSASASIQQTEHIPLVLDALIDRGSSLHQPWLKIAFIFFLVGYGTKMGLAPLHTWLPDAHSESPSLVSALLSGALLNCAFLGILRVHQVCAAAGLMEFSQSLMVVFGLLSMAFAAVFILGQSDFKRLLAYSSVEHMGILSLGIGLGKNAVWGAMLHAVNHSLTKAMLFLVAGNILARFQSKSCQDVTGLIRLMPLTGLLWLAGFLAITGSPPFGPFLSEFTILKAALDEGRIAVAVLYLVLLGVIFIGMATPFLHMAQGNPSPNLKRDAAFESVFFVIPPVALSLLALLLGIYIPDFLNQAIQHAAQVLGGQ